MPTVTMLLSSVSRLADGIVETYGRTAERAWIENVLRKELTSGDQLSSWLSRAPSSLVRKRTRLESDAFRRAARLGEPVWEVVRHVSTAQWRDISIRRPNGDAIGFGEIVDWLLCLGQDDPRTLAKLPRITLTQAAEAAYRWHLAMASNKSSQFLTVLDDFPYLPNLDTSVVAPPADPERSLPGDTDPAACPADAWSSIFDGRDAFAQPPPIGPYLFELGSGCQRVPETNHLLIDSFRHHIADETSNRVPSVSVEPARTESFLDMGNGRTWTRLMNRGALDDETERMGHCVGRGSYDDAVEDGSLWILSLRSETGQSFCTVAWSPGKREVSQIKGPMNAGISGDNVENVIALVDMLYPLSVSQHDLYRSGMRIVPCETPGLPVQVERGICEIRTKPIILDEFWRATLLLNTGIHHAIPLFSVYDRNPCLNPFLMDNGVLLPHPWSKKRAKPRSKVTANGQGRLERVQATRSVKWTGMRDRYSVDKLKSIACNPTTSAADRQEAVERLRDLLSPERRKA